VRSVGSLLRGVLAALAVTLGAGCATIPPNAGQNPADPWEVYNRHMFDLNDRVDRAVLKPIAQVYAEYLPEPVRDCVSNVFSNFNDVPNALNNLLQAKPVEAVSDICRVAINSTVGLLGCFDVAGKMGLQRSEEDFGQTLGRWGSAAGPYFVWPFLGPSSVRDAFGRVVGFYTDPVDYLRPIALRNSMLGLRLVDTRALILPAERLLDAAALDRYQFIRDAYLQRRNNLVFDGNPPRPRSDDEEDAAADPPAARPAPPPAAPADKPAAPPAETPSVTPTNPPPAPGQSPAVPDGADQPAPAVAR
jgi:phospholipid-binding lipoprotein MlaA